MDESFEINLGSAGNVEIRIERSRRAKRMTLRVLADERIVVIIPESLRGNVLSKAKTFAEASALWLKRVVSKMRKSTHPKVQSLFELLCATPEFSAYGNSYALEFGTATLSPFSVFRQSSPVAVLCLRTGFEDEDLEFLLKKIAGECLPKRARELAERCDVSIGNISVRSQRSRWGSCTAGGNLSLNWRLILLPPHLQDHVILHELAHRIHMNHSGEFWDLLNAWDANTGTHDRELSKVWGPRLFSISNTAAENL